MTESLPVIDFSHGAAAVATDVDAACRTTGFFYMVGHGVDAALVDAVVASAREFFALDDVEKAQIAMAKGGRAWRGWFPVGGELTSGVPDEKEGIYFGVELPSGDPRPLHGPNLFPARPARLREAVLAYIDAVTSAGQLVLEAMAIGLGLEGDWFRRNLTADPLVLFRIFHYPPARTDGWGVGEHTDYGLITLLLQDDVGGLAVHARDGWIDAPPIPGSFVVNLGDMLERMTQGAYLSTPHRVLNDTARDRISLPLFLDPAWDADVRPVPVAGERRERERWDNANVHDWSGTYGDYLLSKVSRVFPQLRDEVL